MSLLGDEDRAPQNHAFGTGKSIGGALKKVKEGVDRAEQVGQGVAAAGVDSLTAPIRRAANTAANVGRGIGAATGITPDAQPMPFNPTPMQDAVAKARPEVYGLSRPTVAPTAPTAPANVAAAPVAPPAASPAVNVITPSNPASMALSPPSRAAGGSGMPMAASAPVPVPTAASPVVGQFNGRDITRDQANDLAGQVPVAGGPVSAGPNGSFAFTPPGSMASAAAQTAPAPQPAQTALDVPRFVPPSVNTTRVAQAERERAGLVKQLDSQISSMATRPNGLNSRGERQLYAQLIAQRSGLTQQAGDLAGQAAGQQVGAETTAGVAGMGEVGGNARALLSDRGDTARLAMRQAGETARTIIKLNAPEYKADADGNVVRAQGASFAPVIGPAGEVLKAPTTAADGQITPEVQLDALVKQLAAEQSALKPDPQRLAGLQQQISAMTLGEQVGPATGATAVNPETGERVHLNPATGQWEPIPVAGGNR